MGETFIVDAHHHVWDLSVRDQPWTNELPILRQSFSLDDLEPHLDENGVDVTVLVQTLNIPDETPELLRMAGRSSFVAGVVGWVDLLGDVDRQISKLKESSGGKFLLGFRHVLQDEDDPNWLVRRDVVRGLDAVGKHGLTFDVLVRHDQIECAIEVATLLPHVNFVLDHFGNPPVAQGEIDEWRRQMAELAESQNVAVKLSGLVTVADHEAWTVEDLAPYADVVLECFGAQRVMFGSDWPVCQLAASYTEVIEAARELTQDLSERDRDWVFGLSARAWYGLEIG